MLAPAGPFMMPPEVEEAELLAGAPRGNSGAPVLRLDAWEGPLDLLLEPARAQGVDMARIAVTELAEQFVAVLDGTIARRAVPLSCRAEWTVMAACLLVLRAPGDIANAPPPSAIDEARPGAPPGSSLAFAGQRL